MFIILIDLQKQILYKRRKKHDKKKSEREKGTGERISWSGISCKKAKKMTSDGIEPSTSAVFVSASGFPAFSFCSVNTAL